MKDAKKRERLAAMLGIEVPKPPSPAEARRRANSSREAEAVILYAEQPSKFLEKECRICHRHFAVNRSHIAFCSDDCRSIHINDVLGLEWSPTGRTPEDRWSAQTGGPEPLIVPPVVLPLLKQRQDVPPSNDFLPSLDDIDALLAE